MPKPKNFMLVETTGLSDRHIAALQVFINKFKQGAVDHGDLKRGKDWTEDMLSERIDENFYAIFELMEIMDARSRKNTKKPKRSKT